MSVNINHQLEQVNNLKITTVGTGASVGTAGIVTYYGDGSQLSGVGGGGSSGITTDAQGNTYAGELAGGSFSGTDPQYNTLFGYDAGGDITIGDFNTCIGWTAGDKITEGYKNVAVGAEALDNCTTGYENVAIGWEAGRSLISGNNNVIVGDAAGRTASYWVNTIAIGPSAASNWGTITDGIAIGANALRNGGNYTIAIGHDAGYSQRSSEYSVYIGHESGAVDQGFDPVGSGNENVAIGRKSLGNIRDGADNTALGASAGIALTSGSNNILIGHDAAASSPSASNEAVIGDLNITKFSIPGIGVTLKDNGGTPTQGHVLTVDANGEASFAAASGGGGSYANSDVDSHLNVGTASTGEVLSWNGSDYDWVAQSSGGGGSADPVGTIVAWAGTAANIPTGYQLCDGSAAATTELQAITGANVPDLRDKFIVGATNSTGDTTYPGLSPGATGGSANAVLIAHSHGYGRATHRSVSDGGVNGAYVSSLTGDTTSTVGQTNTGASSTSQTGTNANLPPYYAFCYIIKHTGTAAGTATTRSVNTYTATAGQTLFPPSGTVPYTVGYIDVYFNGSKLDPTEFTASNGTTVTLTTGASLNDIVELVAYESVNINDITVINDTAPQLGGDLDVNNHDITGTGNMNITGIATANGGQLQTESEVIALAIALG